MALPAEADEERVIQACAPTLFTSGCFLGKFNSDVPPIVSRPTAKWSLQQAEAPQPDSRRRQKKPPPRQPWLLKENGEASHQGQVEGGLLNSQTAASYFLLVPNGDKLIAVPVREWYNFKPVPKHMTLSIDDAEKQMGNPKVAFAASQARLKRFAAQADETAEVNAQREADGDADDDNEWEDAGSARLVKDEDDTKPSVKSEQGGNVQVKAEGEGPEDAEDWEHEEDRADDDLEMGEEGSDADAPPGSPAGTPRGSPGVAARATSPAEGSPEPEEEESDPDAEDDDEDSDEDEDLDDMAANMRPNGQHATPQERTPTPGLSLKRKTPEQQSSASAPAAAAANKRKSRTPPADTEPSKKAKRERQAASVEAPQVPAAPQADTSKFGDMSEENIISVLHKFGAMRVGELTERMKLNKRALHDDKPMQKVLLAKVQRVASTQSTPNGKIFTLKPGLMPAR